MSQSKGLSLSLEIAKRRAQLSFHYFCQKFLPDHFRLPFAPFQMEMVGLVEGLTGGLMHCEEDPREHGKSTIRTIASPMWLSLTKRKTFVILVLETQTAAYAYLSNIRNELESNRRILTAYGTQKPEGSDPRLWQAGIIKLPWGGMIGAIGKGQSPRGLLRDGGRRPDCIIIDDPQSDKDVKSHTTREADIVWLKAALIPAGQEGELDVLVNGTLIAHGEIVIVDDQYGVRLTDVVSPAERIEQLH